LRALLRAANLWNEGKDRLTKPGGGCPGGQQQRLCIARAIAVQPGCAAHGRACSALDPILHAWPSRTDRELKKDYTIVIVTHNMQQPPGSATNGRSSTCAPPGSPAGCEIDDTDKIFSNPTERATEDYISGRFG